MVGGSRLTACWRRRSACAKTSVCSIALDRMSDVVRARSRKMLTMKRHSNRDVLDELSKNFQPVVRNSVY